MKVEFLKKFSKDLDGVKTKSVKESVLRVIELMERVDTLEKIPSIKKLKGHKNAYCVRVGDYRLGLFFRKRNRLTSSFPPPEGYLQNFPINECSVALHATLTACCCAGIL